MRSNDLPRPTEAEEQEALFEWAAALRGTWPELALLYHIANEGKRGAAQGAALVRQGLRKGVPDIHLPVARGGYHSLYIELKTGDGNLSQEQKGWIAALRKQGNYAKACWGWDSARETVKKYMREEIDT